jgi:hypothetical protein
VVSTAQESTFFGRPYQFLRLFSASSAAKSSQNKPKASFSLRQGAFSGALLLYCQKLAVINPIFGLAKIIWADKALLYGNLLLIKAVSPNFAVEFYRKDCKIRAL